MDSKKQIKLINCHNNLHLGDCVETLHYLINVVENNEIGFKFACVPDYHSQLSEMIRDHSDKIKLVSNTQLAQDSIETWVTVMVIIMENSLTNQSTKRLFRSSNMFFIALDTYISINRSKMPIYNKNRFNL